MNYEMNFQMYVGEKEQRAETLRIAKQALIEKGYQDFANKIEANKRDCFMIELDACCTLFDESFNDAISTIYKAIVKELPKITFKGFSGYTWGTLEVGHCFEKANNTLTVCKIKYEGDGCCPECGENVVSADDFDPAKTYGCPDCGDVIPNEELFSYYKNEEITYEIVDGELNQI